MDSFRTLVKVKPGLPIQHQTGIYTTGSCFAQSLGERLRDARFTSTINPFGVSYNALSIHNLLRIVLQKEKPNPAMFVESEGSVRHLDFHSAFRARSAGDLSAALHEKIADAGPALKKARVIILTYGTSWAYRHISTGKIVNNCHKLPAREFEKIFIEPRTMIDSFAAIHRLLNGVSPGVRFILTVSPVRHLRDTLELNQLSKSALILACHELVRSFSNSEYFPAYEIMMDDLRDYRFYDQDMLHPSATAIDYIWQKFAECYFTKETLQLADRCLELNKALSHRAFDQASAEHKAFLRSTLRLAKELHQQDADVGADIVALEQRLNVG